MLRRPFCLLSIVFVYSMYCSPVSCDDRSAQEQPQLFTNEDIERYQTSSDTKAVPEQPVPQEDRKVSRKNKKHNDMEEPEMEYWCKKASVRKKKIDKAGEEVEGIEKELSESKKSLHSGKKTSKLQKRLEKARKQRVEAEKDLADLENEAHRKGAKPGWLRCQI